MAALTMLRDKVTKPLLAAGCHPLPHHARANYSLGFRERRTSA
jgi:hypothetical protein